MPKIVDHDGRRAEFMAASCDVIAAEGLGAATLRRVAARAGCTTGALTHYFPDRATLLVEALHAVHTAAGARMLAIVRRPSADFARLRGVLREALPLDDVRLREWRVWLAFWGATPGDSELSAENTRRHMEWRGLLEIILTPLTRNRPAAKREADLMIALIDGLGLRVALMDAASPDLEEAQRWCEARLELYLRRFEQRVRLRPPRSRVRTLSRGKEE